MVLLGAVSFLIIRPFLTAFLAGCVLAYIFHPIFRRLNKKIKNENITAFVMSLAVIVLLSIPTGFLIKTTADEARFFYITAKQNLFDGRIFDVECQDKDDFVCRSVDVGRKMLADPEIRVYLEQAIIKFSDFVLNEASQLIFSLPRIIMNLFVAFFVCFYATLEGEQWVRRTKKLLPISKRHQKEIFDKIDKIGSGVIYGSVLIALLQGALGALGFFIFGVNSPLLFGLLMAVFALIPFLGTAIVWVPASILMLVEGYVEGDSGLLLRGVLLFFYGLLIISTIDNILKPRLISSQAKVHPVLIMLGVLGGIALIGFIGFIIGPLVLSLFMAFLDVYEHEKEAFRV